MRYLGVDISNAVDVAKQRFAEKGLPAEFLQANLTDLPFRGAVFDVVFSERIQRRMPCPISSDCFDEEGCFFFMCTIERGLCENSWTIMLGKL